MRRIRVGLAAATVLVSALLAVPTAPAGAAGTPAFSVGDASVVEGDAGYRNVKFSVTLSEPSAFTTTVRYDVTAGTATGGTDFTTATAKMLTFKPNIVKGFVTVKTFGDAATEGNETFAVTLSSPTGGAVLGRSAGTGTILNDDANSGVKLSVGDVSVVEGHSGGGAAGTLIKFPVSLNVAAPAPVTVTYATAGGTATSGTDFTAITPKSLTINATKNLKYVTVKVTRDTLAESDETFTVVLSGASGATLARATGTATIIDDELGAVSITGTTPSNTQARNDGSPEVRGTADADAIVDLFKNGTCTGAASASGTGATFAGTGITLAVNTNTTTTISARARDNAGNISACSNTLAYLHDGITPSAPVITGTTPTSPSQDPNPMVRGSAEVGSTVALYTNGTCTGSPAASGTAAAFENPGIVTPVGANALNTLSATATDVAGNTSNCSNGFDYTHDTVAPDAPVITGSTPASPGSSTTPTIQGTSEVGSLVTLYTNGTCSGAPATTVWWYDFPSTWAVVTVPADTTTLITATATDAAGNVSACSTSFSYTHTSAVGLPVAIVDMYLGDGFFGHYEGNATPPTTYDPYLQVWTSADCTGSLYVAQSNPGGETRWVAFGPVSPLPSGTIVSVNYRYGFEVSGCSSPFTIP